MAPRKGNREKFNEGSSSPSGSGGDPPNGTPKVLPSPDLPSGGKVPVRRLQLGNKMQVFLVSTLGSQKNPPWIKFPLQSNAFGSSGSHTMRDVQDILSCSGADHINNVEGNPVKKRCNFSVVIGSGTTSDPINAQGMAHYVEHIVHHGSAKYPEDDSLMNVLCQNNGLYNAFTDREITGYFCDFKFSNGALRLLLDMYADMLTKPKFDIHFIQKEVHSIENELHLRRCHDFFRINQLVHTLGIPGEHPMKKFMCGSLATLFPSSRNAQELQNEILKFHQAHYRPDNMALVVQAPVSLDMLQNYVLETFGSIQRSNPNLKSRGISKSLINPYSIKAFNKLITIKPGNRDIHTLVIHWAFPPEAWKDYKGKPMQYIAEVLSNSHPGGLRHFLKNREWGLEMLAGTNPSGDYCNEYATMFTIIIFLTQKGRDELSDVLEAVFAYIRFVKKDGVKKSEFQRLKASSDVIFRSLPLGNSANDSIYLARRLLLNYDMKHLVTGGSLYFDYNPGNINKYLNELKPEEACFVLVTADTGKLEYMTEEWYGAKYIVQDLDPALLRKFQTGNRFTSSFFDKRPTFPIDANKLTEIENASSIPIPKIFRTSDHISLVYIPVRPIETPQSIYMISVMSNLPLKLSHSKAPAFQVFAEIWKFKAEKKSQYLNQLQLGTVVNIIPNLKDSGFIVSVIGLNLVAKEVVKSLMDELFDENRDEKEEKVLFEIAKQYVLHSYYATVGASYIYAMDLYQRIKYVDNLSAVERYDELKKMTYQDFHSIIQRVKSKICMQGIAIGAVTEAQALEVCQYLETKDFPRMSSDELLKMIGMDKKFEIKTLQMGERCLRMKSILPNEKPFVLLNYYQMDVPTKESRSITAVITRLLKDTVMHELRYKEQLGYALFTFMVSDARNGICILVMANSDRHSICHIDSRIENSIETFFKDKLTRENLILLMKAKNIKRDPAYVQEYARKYLLDKGSTSKEAGYRKLSVHVCHENLHNKCEGNCCHHSKWLIPLFHVGKENAEICVAGPSKPTNQKAAVYFIESAEAFHKYPGK